MSNTPSSGFDDYSIVIRDICIDSIGNHEKTATHNDILGRSSHLLNSGI
jgi:hypothetical protein